MRDRVFGEKKRCAHKEEYGRSWGAKQHPSNIEQLQLDLVAVNRCIEALEKADADPRDIEVLTTHALTLAERIDEMRWLNPAEALDWLFEKAIPQSPLKESEEFRG